MFHIILYKINMQQTILTIKNDLWQNLRNIFQSVAKGKHNITTLEVQNVVKNIIKETDQFELDYIFKNIFRLDLDGNGDVNFNQFANFFLKRHCGEIALQRTHKKGKLKKGSERKLDVTQFQNMLNDAYSILNVKIDQAIASKVFKQFDIDEDNFITYSEYFNFIENYICKSEDVIKAEVRNKPQSLLQPMSTTIPQGKLYKSNLRLFLLQGLKKLYNSFDFNGDGILQVQQIKALIIDILKLKSKKDIQFILFDLFNIGDKGSVSFQDFYSYFIEHVGNLGLSQHSSKSANNKRILNLEEFIKLFRTSFNFLQNSIIKDKHLQKFYNKINKNNQKFITFQQFIAWIKNFLSPINPIGQAYYFQQDDCDFGRIQKNLAEQKQVIMKEIYKSSNFAQALKQTKILNAKNISTRKFSNYQLAKRVRDNIWGILQTFDDNHNNQFQQQQIVQILKTLLNESQIEIPYVIKNVFRYDKDGDSIITFTEMANFLLEIHCGQMAIQRLHMKKIYKLGSQRMMDSEQFVITLTDALNYVRTSASQQELKLLFTDMDNNRDGLISYKEYFDFLKQYFGSESHASIGELVLQQIKSHPSDYFAQYLSMSSIQAFKGLIQSPMKIEVGFLSAILRQVFQQLDFEIDYASERLYELVFNPNLLMNEADITKYILLIHMGFIVLLRGHHGKKYIRWNECLINQKQFIDLIIQATFWAPQLVDTTILVQIFLKLDVDHDGFISYLQYIEFLINVLGLPPNPSRLLDFFNTTFTVKTSNILEKVVYNVAQQISHQNNQGLAQKVSLNSFQQVSKNAQIFYDKIWNQLRVYFNSYLKAGITKLGRDDIKLLIKDVLKQQTDQEVDYVFWNYFKLDSEGDQQVQFLQFAPFILNHACEIALQKFHSTQKKGKSNLSVQEFIVLSKMAFVFLPGINQEEGVVRQIYEMLDTNRNGQLTYKQYLVWSKKLVNRYKSQ